MAHDMTNKRQAKLAWLTIVLLMLNLFDSDALANQRKRCKDVVVTPRRSVSRVEERPQLGVDYSQVAKFKLISRKKTYHLGEMISLDLALLNISGSKIFFRKLSDFNITLAVRDEKGSTVEIWSYTIDLEAVVSDSYVVVDPDSIITWTYQLISGLKENDELEKYIEAKHSLYKEGRLNPDKERFNRGLFLNIGRGALDISNPGVYTITATATNDYVVVSPCEGNPKTAVGKIISAPLEITIVP